MINKQCSDEVNPRKKPYKFSNQRLKDLGLQFTPVEQCLYETVKSLQDKGHLPNPMWIWNVELCGMTGTAAIKSAEFQSMYKLKVTIVPSNKPKIRKDESDVFKGTTGKWCAVVVEVSKMHKIGHLALVGTTSVKQSDSLSEQLREARIPYEYLHLRIPPLTQSFLLKVLNVKPENVEREAEIVAQSGRFRAVTIPIIMAG
ncbi:hypothetical protein ACLOJK_028230 [Asimina triloba]